MSVSKSPRAASIHFVNCGCLALRFWLPLLVTGMGLWANPGSGQAAEASATQYRYDYFYVKNGDAITKVEASPSAAKPDWWVACFYKPGETPDGSSKGQWGQLSQKNLGDLMVEVKKRQEQEINDKYPPVGGVIMTYLNACYPVAYYYKSGSQTKTSAAAGDAQTGTDDSSAAGSKNNGSSLIPWPDLSRKFDGLLTRADLARAAKAWCQQFAADANINPVAKVGITTQECMNQLLANVQRVEKLQQDLNAGLLLPKEQFNDTIDAITASLNQSLITYDHLKNNTPNPVIRRNPLLEDARAEAARKAKAAELAAKSNQVAQASAAAKTTPVAKPAAGPNPFEQAASGKASGSGLNPFEQAASGQAGGAPANPFESASQGVRTGPENPFEKEARLQAEERARQEAIRREQERQAEIARQEQERQAELARQERLAEERQAERQREIAQMEAQRRQQDNEVSLAAAQRNADDADYRRRYNEANAAKAARESSGSGYNFYNEVQANVQRTIGSSSGSSGYSTYNSTASTGQGTYSPGISLTAKDPPKPRKLEAISCPDCSGSGICQTCKGARHNGTKEVPDWSKVPKGAVVDSTPVPTKTVPLDCIACSGTGKCTHCQGTGKLQAYRTVDQ